MSQFIEACPESLICTAYGGTIIPVTATIHP